MHYLNVPYPDDNKMVIASSISLWGDKKEWTKDELISQLKPMCKFLDRPIAVLVLIVRVLCDGRKGGPRVALMRNRSK